MSVFDRLFEWFSSIGHDDDEDCVRVTVHKGDSLWSIADSITGDGERWHELADANPEQKWSQDYVVRPGQELRIPKSWADD
jgi:nucleoid-associated protein YgaU